MIRGWTTRRPPPSCCSPLTGSSTHSDSPPGTSTMTWTSGIFYNAMDFRWHLLPWHRLQVSSTMTWTSSIFYHDMDFRYLLPWHRLQVASFTMTWTSGIFYHAIDSSFANFIYPFILKKFYSTRVARWTAPHPSATYIIFVLQGGRSVALLWQVQDDSSPQQGKHHLYRSLNQ